SLFASGGTVGTGRVVCSHSFHPRPESAACAEKWAGNRTGLPACSDSANQPLASLLESTATVSPPAPRLISRFNACWIIGLLAAMPFTALPIDSALAKLLK